MKILNVAEKNSVAKEISRILSRSTMKSETTQSKFNLNYRFNMENFQHFSKPAQMTFTSVAGHFLSRDFKDERLKRWSLEQAHLLYTASIETEIAASMKAIESNIRKLAGYNDTLIIWTDCDREGEFIGNDIKSVSSIGNPNINVYRAVFSDLSQTAIFQACRSLTRIDQRKVDAVATRMEMDLRIGASFTRAQTLSISNKLNEIDKSVALNGKICEILNKGAKNLVTFGPCQIPTLNLVVERDRQIKEFVPEAFYYLNLEHRVDGELIKFNWNRDRLFDMQITKSLFNHICGLPKNQHVELNDSRSQKIKITNVEKKNRTLFPPLPLNTVEMERKCSNAFKISPAAVLSIAEKLYCGGYISYPRTETNIFPDNFNYKSVVDAVGGMYGPYVRKHLNKTHFKASRAGKCTDKAHPPIYPIKMYPDDGTANYKVFQFIVCHFLACISEPAKYEELTVTAVPLGLPRKAAPPDWFTTVGTKWVEMNFLEIYSPFTPVKKDVVLPSEYTANSTHNMDMSVRSGLTTPPSHLTYSELLRLMEHYNIGTDATQATHIETIESRNYIVNVRNCLIAQPKGTALIEALTACGLKKLLEPDLRGKFEQNLLDIVDNKTNKKKVLDFYVNEYKVIFCNFLKELGLFTQKFVEVVGRDADGYVVKEADSKKSSFAANTNKPKKTYARRKKSNVL